MAAFYSHRRSSPVLSPLLGMPGGGGTGQVVQAFALLSLMKEVAELSWRPPLTLALMALNAVGFCAKGRLVPLIGPWTVASCGFDGQRAYLLLRVVAVAARGQSRRLRWGSTRGVGVALRGEGVASRRSA